MTTQAIQLRGVTPTQEQARAIEQILRLDFGPILYTLVTPRYGQPPMKTREQADRAVLLFRVYLILVVLFPDEMLVPPLEADDVWHLSLEDNGWYNQVMAEIFGFVLLHFPYLGTRGPEDVALWKAAAGRTRQLYLDVANIDLGGMPAGGSCTTKSMAQCDHDGAGCGQDGGFAERPRLADDLAAV